MPNSSPSQATPTRQLNHSISLTSVGSPSTRQNRVAPGGAGIDCVALSFRVPAQDRRRNPGRTCMSASSRKSWNEVFSTGLQLHKKARNGAFCRTKCRIKGARYIILHIWHAGHDTEAPLIVRSGFFGGIYRTPTPHMVDGCLHCRRSLSVRECRSSRCTVRSHGSRVRGCSMWLRGGGFGSLGVVPRLNQPNRTTRAPGARRRRTSGNT